MGTDKIKRIETEIKRIGYNHEAVGPAESLCVERRPTPDMPDAVRLWDDWNDVVLPVDTLLGILLDLPNDVTHDGLWTPLCEAEERRVT